MNKQAMELPKDQLLPELERRWQLKKRKQEELDSCSGGRSIRITSYMENIGWPELFGYDMNRLLDDADFNMEQSLRQMIFWADNVDDDSIPGFAIPVTVGMYWDMTLFGQEITHTPDGVPEFFPAHPLQREFDLSFLGEFNFHTSGLMPKLLAKYEEMKEVSSSQYGGKLQIPFPQFRRGPLDTYIQIRGYENFLEDVVERPEELLEALNVVVETRMKFRRDRAQYLGEPLPESSFVGDDWVNVPFISPSIFREFAVPVYRRLRSNEGPVTGFHTCGNLLEVVEDLLGVFPEIRTLDVSPWNDLTALDRVVDPEIAFSLNVKNTDSLGNCGSRQEEILETIASIAQHRRVPSVCAQAVVKFCPTYEETLTRLNSFIARSKAVLNQGSC